MRSIKCKPKVNLLLRKTNETQLDAARETFMILCRRGEENYNMIIYHLREEKSEIFAPDFFSKTQRSILVKTQRRRQGRINARR